MVPISYLGFEKYCVFVTWPLDSSHHSVVVATDSQSTYLHRTRLLIN